MEWEHPLFLGEGPKFAEADIPQPPPCYLRRHPSYPWGPWPLFVTCYPSEELPHPPPVHDLASSFLGLAWPLGRGQ